MVGDRLLFSVAVGKAPKLDPLPGTYTVAREMESWGAAAGFISLSITDETAPVTAGRINSLMVAQLKKPGRVIDHVIFHFSGHGFIMGVEQILLLSQWSRVSEEAIHLSKFRRRFERYGLKRVTLIIDACKTYQSTMTADVEGSGILEFGDFEQQPVDVDHFSASAKGRPAYMLRGKASEKPVCLFTAVILQVLAGVTLPAEEQARGIIRSWTIKEYIDDHFKEIAAGYKVDQRADCSCGFPRNNDIYAALPIGEYQPPRLPKTEAAQAMAVNDGATEATADSAIITTKRRPVRRWGTPIDKYRNSASSSRRMERSVAGGARGMGKPELANRRHRKMLGVPEGTGASGKKRTSGSYARRNPSLAWASKRSRSDLIQDRFKLTEQATVKDLWRPRIEVPDLAVTVVYAGHERPRNWARQTTPATAALRQLANASKARRATLAPGLFIISTLATPIPELLTRNDTVVGLRLSGSMIAPVQMLPGLTTVAYIDGTLPDGGLLALDWQPTDASAAERDATLRLLAELADNRLLPQGLPRNPAGGVDTKLVEQQPMAALVHAFLADGSGDRQGVQALATRFREVYGVVPYDLAVLIGHADRSALLGACPLFSASWRLLEDTAFSVDPALIALTPGMARGHSIAVFAEPAAADFVSFLVKPMR